MKITITRTTPTYAGPTAGVFVQWDVQAALANTTLVFTLYRGGSPAGPFDVVMDNITDLHYEDQHIPSYSNEQTLALTALQREMYYRVEAAGVISDPTPVGDGLPKRYRLMRRKIQRDITVSLRVGDGVPFTMLPRKHWGIRCTACFDKLTKSVMNSKCKSCYGTGFLGGYEGGYNLLARKGTTNVQSNIAPQGTVEVNQIQLVMLDYPRVQVDDVFVETRQDRRYVVKHVTRTELRGVPVHQQLVISELGRDSVEYFVPVPTGPPQEHY